MVERTSISLESEVMALLKRLGEAEVRDTSNMVEWLILKEAATRGWIKSPGGEPKKSRRGGALSGTV